MKKLVGLMLAFGMTIGTSVSYAESPMDSYVQAEGQYWLLGTPNDHQRYTAICGVYRQDADEKQLEVVQVEEYDSATNLITGTSVGGRVVVQSVTNDMDYVYGAMAISRLCAEITTILTEATANALATGASEEAQRFIRAAVPE